VPERIHLPADGDRLHLHGKRRHEARSQELGESAMAQSGELPRGL